MIGKQIRDHTLQPDVVQHIDPAVLIQTGPALIVAPHPDDESLGCGGLIALATEREIPVHVVVMSDGVGSHRNSKKFPPERLRAVRRSEALAALDVLGVPSMNVSFLDLPDQHVPHSGSAAFSEAISRMSAHISRIDPTLIVAPWRRDPHCDHEGSWQIVREAARQTGFTGRWLEYAVWLAELGEDPCFPRPGEMRTRSIDITSVLPKKRAAISRHRSQTTDLIDDDPDGFRLSEHTLARFDVPVEIYLEPVRD